MQKLCANDWCKEFFEITPEDMAFYEKVSPIVNGKTYAIPLPDMCFSCRLQRRAAFYNSRSLYRRTCDLTGKPIISVFSPDKPFKVYDKDAWFTDAWDPLFYGRTFDFSRPFFPQFRELMEAVPLQSISHIGPDNINSDFTNDNYKVKTAISFLTASRPRTPITGIRS